MNSVRKGLSFVVTGALLSLGVPAWADAPTGTVTNESQTGSARVTLEGSVASTEIAPGVEGSLLHGDATFFANPGEIGFEASGSLAQISAEHQFGDGQNGADCTGSAGIGVVTADARLGIGVNSEDRRPSLTTDSRGRSHRTNGQFASNKERNRAKIPPGIECSASVSANLAEVKGECAVTVGGVDLGTVGATVDGPGAKAECTCSGCEIGAYLVNVEGSYDSPSIGGCGLKASAHVKGGAGVGLKLGAGGASKGVGGRLAVGPFSIDAGISIDQFDPAAMGDCALTALKNVGDLAVNTFNAVSNTLGDIGNTAGNMLSSAGDALGSAAHSLCFWCSDDSPKPSAPAAIPGTNVARNAPTNPLAPVGVGIPIPGMPSVAHGVNRN